MNWREMAGDKLMSPEEAVKVIGSGDVIGVGPDQCYPLYPMPGPL